MKHLILAIVLLFSLSGFTQDNKFIFREHIDVFTGIGYGFNDFALNKANDLNSTSFIYTGFRYNAFKEALCVQMDYNFAIPLEDINYKYTGSILLDISILRFEKSFVFLGAKYQTMSMSFLSSDLEALNKYTINGLSSVGPSLRFKNKAFNLEVGYLFGVNKAKWEDTYGSTLPEERNNSFYIKGSINLSLLNK